eukprot:5607774-Amphidinium_carterae.1
MCRGTRAFDKDLGLATRRGSYLGGWVDSESCKGYVNAYVLRAQAAMAAFDWEAAQAMLLVSTKVVNRECLLVTL